MPRQAAVSVENNFKNGLVTDASGLNFPEAACTETYDCVFNLDGSVERRLGFDFEAGNTPLTANRTQAAVTTYLWRNVSGDGNLSLVVHQVGLTLYFYTINGGLISRNAIANTVSLSSYVASGAPSAAQVECQFTDGNGYLFVTHSYASPIRIAYVASTASFTVTAISLKIRDFEGLDDGLAVTDRPTTSLGGMTATHKYNLYNQGWTTTNLTTWDTSRSDMPSNADIMWTFKNASDAFDLATIANGMEGNTPAAKGHFILTLWDQDRATASGVSGAASKTSEYQRPSTAAFHAGRLFYSGINYPDFNSNVYFTQIVERPEQYGFCYQAQDPTAEDIHDLLPSDGGVISIPEAGSIFKVISIAGGLAVFAANGVWTITGSTGIGFSATDYNVSKLPESPRTLSATSFVNVGGTPAWWNEGGAYILSTDGQTAVVKSMTNNKIKSFFDEIPIPSKAQARGAFNSQSGIIQWLYRSTEATTTAERYEYDRVMCFDIRTGAFYPWTISAGAQKVNSILCLDIASAGVIVETQVINAAGDTVRASSNNVVVPLGGASTLAPVFKYLTSQTSGSSYAFSVAETNNENYVDWALQGESTNYLSYFISGYAIRGNAMNKFQSNWVRLFSDSTIDTAYYVRGMWDYSLSGNTGRWSTNQLISHTAGDYRYGSARRKIRGHGLVLQFMIQSYPATPFKIIGWSAFETANASP